MLQGIISKFEHLINHFTICTHKEGGHSVIEHKTSSLNKNKLTKSNYYIGLLFTCKIYFCTKKRTVSDALKS